jgi:thioredoxin-related protein
MRKLFFLLLLLVTASNAIAAGSRPPETVNGGGQVVPANLRLDVSQDMNALGKLSREKGVPILLMFSTEDCSYCKRLERDVLGPMRKAGIDPKRVILRKVLMDEYDTLRDFSGRERNAESFSIYRGVEIVPTLQLVDAEGNELVPKIVGYQSPGLYNSYLEKAIEVSQGLLEKK